MVTKILIPSILILVILFLLLRKKENFKVSTTLELTFDAKDSIFLIADNMKYIDQSVEGTKIYKTNRLIYSNKALFSESGEYSGFLFSVKPNQRMNIGFSNIETDPKNKISHGINIIDDGVFEIVEKVEETDNFVIQDIDFCLAGELDICLKSNNKFKFNSESNFLAIVLNNNVANYLIIKRNENGEYGSMLIHKGKNKLNFPLRLKAIANDQEVLMPSLLWTKHSFVYDSPVYWSVETSFKDDYDNKVLDIVPMPSYTDNVKQVIPAPSSEDDDGFDFGDAFGPGVRKILITNVKTDGLYYQIDFIHNLDVLYLKINKDRLFLKLYLDDNTYIFRKYDNINDLKLFKNDQKVESIEIVIGDVISHKYTLSESNIVENDLKKADSPSPSPY